MSFLLLLLLIVFVSSTHEHELIKQDCTVFTDQKQALTAARKPRNMAFLIGVQKSGLWGTRFASWKGMEPAIICIIYAYPRLLLIILIRHNLPLQQACREPSRHPLAGMSLSFACAVPWCSSVCISLSSFQKNRRRALT